MYVELNRTKYFIMPFGMNPDAFIVCVEDDGQLKQIAGPYMSVEELEADLSAIAEKWENDRVEQL